MVRPKLVEIGEPIINQFTNANSHVNVQNSSFDKTIDDIDNTFDINNNAVNSISLLDERQHRQQHQQQQQQQQQQSSLQRAAAEIIDTGISNYKRGRNNFNKLHHSNQQQYRQQHYVIGDDTPSSYNIDILDNNNGIGRETGVRSTDKRNTNVQHFAYSQQQSQQSHPTVSKDKYNTYNDSDDDFFDVTDIKDTLNDIYTSSSQQQEKQQYQQNHLNQSSYHQRPIHQSLSISTNNRIPQQQYRQQQPQQQQRRQHIEIGADTTIYQSVPVPVPIPVPVVERMNGIQDHSYKGPMIVLDGANIAYAYSQALLSTTNSTSSNSNYNNDNVNRYRQSSPLSSDARGIEIASNFFLLQHYTMRIVIVLKQSYYTHATSYQRSYNNSNNNNNSKNALYYWKELFDTYIPQNSKHIKLLLAPVHDDDDAYCLSICQQENYRAQYRSNHNGVSWAYILSNDLYRDAIQRQNNTNNKNINSINLNDDPSSLRYYLKVDVRGSAAAAAAAINKNNNNNNNDSNSIVVGELGCGRISYTFVDMDTIDTYGEPLLDFIPNPRHPLIQWIANTNNNTTSS